MADIFVEVDEALKQERLEKIWKKYGGLFIGCLTAIVLGTAANEGYKAWSTAQNVKQTASYVAATDKENHGADDILTVLPDLKGGLRGLAEINAAGLALKNGDTEKAREIYTAIAADPNLDRTIADLAAYMKISLLDSTHADDKRAALNAVIMDQKNAWRYHALLDAAVFEANTAKDFSAARKHIAEILTAKDVPSGLQKKAQSLDILYALKEKI